AAMNDLMRPALYDAYHAIVPIKSGSDKAMTYDVVGPVCESGDWLGKDRALAVQEGDVLAILSAGAYGFVMASNYNTRGRPAEVMVDGDQAHLVRERETTNSLFANESSANPPCNQTRLSFQHLTSWQQSYSFVHCSYAYPL
ncbi:MAG: hypothetical protein RLZZ452_1193, partial [Pseudomonadota bacterium]